MLSVSKAVKLNSELLFNICLYVMVAQVLIDLVSFFYLLFFPHYYLNEYELIFYLISGLFLFVGVVYKNIYMAMAYVIFRFVFYCILTNKTDYFLGVFEVFMQFFYQVVGMLCVIAIYNIKKGIGFINVKSSCIAFLCSLSLIMSFISSY